MLTLRLDKKVYDKDTEKKIKERIAGKVDMQLGKNGITQGFLSELKNRLEKHGVVKVRVLKSYRRTSEVSIEDVAKQLASSTNSRIYEIRGFTIILVREK